VIGDRHDDAGVREAVLLPVSGQHALAGFAPAVTVIHELDRHRADECGSFEYVWDQAGFLGCHGPGDSGRRAATLERGPRVDIPGGKNLQLMSALADVGQTNFQDEVLGSKQPVLVDFWAPWCGPCKMLSPVVEKVAAANGGKAKFVKLNTDDNPSIAGQYQVSGIPCLILFKDGQPVDRIVGYVPENVISGMLAKHVA
jgi:thioredoxin 1